MEVAAQRLIDALSTRLAELETENLTLRLVLADCQGALADLAARYQEPETPPLDEG